MTRIDNVNYIRNIPALYKDNPAARIRQCSSKIVELSKLVQADAIHATSKFANGLAAEQAASELGIPWIYEVRGREELTWLTRLDKANAECGTRSEYFQKFRNQEIGCAFRCDQLITISQQLAKEFEAEGVPSNKIKVIPNGVDDSTFEYTLSGSESKRLLGLEEKIYIGTISSIVAYEGIEILIRAAGLLPTNYHVLVVGDGTSRVGLESLSHRLNLSDRVTFVGQQPFASILPWYKSLDAFVMPRLDTLVTRSVTPIKALAAQALRVPVIASDLPAIREVTGNLASYFEAGSAQSLANAIVNRHEVDIEGAYAFAQSRRWSEIARSLRSVYMELSR